MIAKPPAMRRGFLFVRNVAPPKLRQAIRLSGRRISERRVLDERHIGGYAITKLQETFHAPTPSRMATYVVWPPTGPA